jgi:hypothetical protein
LGLHLDQRPQGSSAPGRWRQLTELCIKEVIKAGGRVIQLMTKDTGFFERWFTVSRDYREEGWKLMTLQLGTVAL